MKRPCKLNQRKSSLWNCVVFMICAFLITLLEFNFWFSQEFTIVEVSGGSMEDTLSDGDVLYADRYDEPNRGDIIIIDVSPYSNEKIFHGKYIIKRLIALEGDSVKCEDNALYLRKAGTEEYVLLEEPYTNYRTDDFEELTVGVGEIFFLGDHRTNSTDSRVAQVGCLKLTDIVGVVPEWSIKHKGIINIFEQVRFAVSRIMTKE